MRKPLVPILLLCVSLAGCLSTIRIKRDPLNPDQLKQQKENTNVQGIPFYVKVAKCKQQTTWIEPVYTLTLKRTIKLKFVDEDAAKKEAEKTKQPDKLKLEPQIMNAAQVLSLSNYQNTPAIRELQALLSKAAVKSPAPVDQVEEKWNVIASLPPDLPPNRDEDALIEAKKDVIMVANTSAPEALVDYSRVYYYNTPRPWVGSSQADVKLATDGTMTEGSSQVQSQTLSTILSALPISSVISGAAKAAGLAAATKATLASEDPFATTIDKVDYELTIQQEAYKHTHTAYADFGVPCTLDANGVKKNYALTLETPAGGSAKKEDDNTVKVNGTVVLPKPAASTDKK